MKLSDADEMLRKLDYTFLNNFASTHADSVCPFF